MAHRVVVTGWGVISSIGLTADFYWANLSRGVCGISNATRISAVGHDEFIAAEVKNFDPHAHFDERRINTLDRVSQFAVVAARQAIAHANITFDRPLSKRTAASYRDAALEEWRL